MNPAELLPGSAVHVVGDVHDVLASLPDGSVDLFVTSPPFLALRSYLPADHPDKHREIGGEPTPAVFLDTLLGLTAEWGRVLAPHGSIAVELGDTYSGSGGAGGDYNADGLREGQAKFDGSNHRRGRIVDHDSGRRIPGWPLDKSLTGIPGLYASSLAYGRNLLREPFSAVELLQWIDGLRASGYTAEAALAAAGGWVAEHGEPQRFPRWRVRNLIPWVRPNPPVGQLGDKCRPATSYITVATLARDRWWDMEDCRTPLAVPEAKGIPRRGTKLDDDGGRRHQLGEYDATMSAGAPLLDWWRIPTAPYPGAHYATFPPELPARLTKLMCPHQVCRQCGHPRRRIMKAEAGYAERLGSSWADRSDGRTKADGRERNSHSGQPVGEHITAASYETLGWTHCGCGDGCQPTVWESRVVERLEVQVDGKWQEPEAGIDYAGCKTRMKRKRKRVVTDLGVCRDQSHHRPGIVVDPFAGTGTTLVAATGLGRAAIGIDLDDRNADLARRRLGMFLDVVA